ncbi:hypothetical protein K469DRAFT_719571 [Zopfia rhizophila CBS 207.26]|uniref:Membrane anchor Opy2 N-terminal domain-containing protein n=1 Tax=Zopfia rhizophila CBS 207.26 TaxID=1314779 RepID=A0A6A6DGS4_9PEZI|nr:hypothetical protein K469DRAFT_719571 [Zopfia rhizophila CBS 207.26]
MSTILFHPYPERRQMTTMAPPTTSQQACTWPGHCLGATCNSNDDCDNDWICANKVCSPCCETSSPTTSTAASASASAALKPHQGLTTGSTIGIGVSIVGFLAVVTGIAFWIWRMRRRKTQNDLWEAPTNEHANIELDASSAFTEDRKQLVGNESCAELASMTKPGELSSVELVELEGDYGRQDQATDMQKPPITKPLEVADAKIYGQLRFSPVSETSPYPSHPGSNGSEERWHSFSSR